MTKRYLALFLLICVVAFSGFGCKTAPKGVQEKMKPVVLNYWRVFDEADDFQDTIAKYQAAHPYITINYRKLRFDEYEQALLEALAEDKGPDIFSIQSSWSKKYQSKIAPLPESISMAYLVTKGTLKKEVVPELRTVRSITPNEVKNNFIDTVFQDAVLDYKDPATNQVKSRVYGLPLAIDTLAMFYNKDLLNNAGIVDVPTYWNRDFQQSVKKLTRQNSKGEIIQAGVALGGSNNINRSSDILTSLMMQNGASIIENGTVAFQQIPPAFAENNYNPGMEAVRFYCDFASQAKEVYSWNNNLENALDMFLGGRLAIMFGYSYDLETIKARAPKLNFVVKKFPQIEGNTKEVNSANYWLETVSNKSKNINEAWDFVQFATKAENVKSFLDKTKKPTALRSLIPDQINNEELSVFASQLLTAKSWYQGRDVVSAERFINEMIDTVILDPEKLEAIVNATAGKIQQTLN